MHATTPTGQIVLSLNVLVDKCRKKWFELKEAVSLFCNIKQEDKVMEGLLLNNEVKATQWLGNKQVSVYRFTYIFYQD